MESKTDEIPNYVVAVAVDVLRMLDAKLRHGRWGTLKVIRAFKLNPDVERWRVVMSR